MTVAAHKGFDCHAKKARSLPWICSGLHQPRCRCMAQYVWSHVGPKPSIFHNCAERLLYRCDRFGVPFDGEPLPPTLPPSQMAVQLGGQWNRRFALLSLAFAFGAPIENAPLYVNPSASNGRL